MSSFKTLNNIAGWLVFGIAAVVLGLAAEPTGSLWDCGEFISGAYKLQVVHPPGAPIFLLVGRLFTWVAQMFSDNPANIAYAVNLLSALCTAGAALFVCWSTTILARLMLVGRGGVPEGGQAIAVLGAGLVAGLVTAFTTSIWFSAVEGEVYAMSTFFTAMTFWAVLKWYNLPDDAESDRWLVFAMYSAALSIGVHLLSLLTFPALAMFYYFKKSKRPTVMGTLIAAFIGVVFIVAIQKIIIAGVPGLWASFDRMMVNGFGLPFYSGIVLVAALFAGAIWFGLRYASRTGNGLLQRIVVAFGVVLISYLSYGVVIIRAAANTPINMNDPSDPMRLLPYLNREQYGERPLLRGPNFDVKIPEQVDDIVREDRWGRVGNKYEVVDEKVDYDYSPSSEVLFPRRADYSQGRPAIYRQWIEKKQGPYTTGDNIKFFVRYQLGWMYWRYFMWNFSGRQNGEQGYYPWDPSAGHWVSGIAAIDEPRIGNQSQLPDFQKNNQAHNVYYMIPFLLGLIGMFFHFRSRPRDFAALMALFIITGIGIIVYSNQPPNEPRERDYVLAGSFFTYAIWIGLSVPGLFRALTQINLPSLPAAGLTTALGLVAPLLMVTQNWDDHSRANHYGSRDYARNFLESCEPNAIIFTYGDNDTYPLWYCQEVEGIRTDVRVVNLSLIAVDWYIDQLRRRVNASPAIKMSIPAEQLRGFKRIQTPFYAPRGAEQEMTLQQVVKFLGEDHKLPAQGGRDFDTYLPTRKIVLPVDKASVMQNNVLQPNDSTMVDTMYIDLGKDKSYIIKDELAMLDIIASNLWERPIYWAVTCREDKLLGFDNYLQLEGLSLRIVPVKSRGSVENYGIIGNGRVATDVAFRNIMEKWQWGNFDKHRTYVDRSYMPSLQTMRVTMIRVARQLVLEGKKEQAVQLADRYFEVFPAFNFQYDQFAALMADIYGKAEQKEKATAKIREIAKSQVDILNFVASQPPAFQKGYGQDQQFALGTDQTLMRTADDMKDEALSKQIADAVAAL
ncbi:MAG TPA: DUF2723 domain-containing protein, partial [Saprospiraceae bacterium]|nr:DUF2723 domain-containing protein [Saprospiraceae bacterium]